MVTSISGLNVVGETVCFGDNYCFHDTALQRLFTTFDQQDYEGIEATRGEIITNTSNDTTILRELLAPDPSTSSIRTTPGTPLECWSEEDDEETYDAIVLSTSPEEDYVSVIFPIDSEELWVPSDWCDVVDQDELWSSGGGNFLYTAWDKVFHRAFNLLNREFPSVDPSIFSYWEGKEIDEDYNVIPSYLPQWFNSFTKEQGINGDHPIPIYAPLPKEHIAYIDDKFDLYELYKDNMAAHVFPRTFGSIREVLEATANDSDKDGPFYVKESGETRGEGIEILKRPDLIQKLNNDGDYEHGHVVIQSAVKDLLTVDVGSGPLASRRFDIRFFFIIHAGRAYIHSNMWTKWVLDGPTYDADDTDVTHQIPNLAVYGGGDTARLIFPDVGPEWNKGLRAATKPLPPGHIDPMAWRDELALALDQAKPAFRSILKASSLDPNRYHIVGGDAMIKSNGKAVIVEFNPWADLGKYERLEDCLYGSKLCRRMVLLDESNETGYHISEPTPATDIVSSERLAYVIRDTAAMVLGLQKPSEILGLREIGRNHDDDQNNKEEEQKTCTNQ